MRITPINTVSSHNRIKTASKPSFNAKLYITGEAEDLIKFLAYDASKGDTSKYIDLVKGFGLFMEDLSKKLEPVKPENQIATVDLHPYLKEFMALPPETRGTYTRDNMCILLGWPFTQQEYRYFPFTYRPNNYNLADTLCEYVKNLIKNK